MNHCVVYAPEHVWEGRPTLGARCECGAVVWKPRRDRLKDRLRGGCHRHPPGRRRTAPGAKISDPAPSRGRCKGLGRHDF
jgi:hypothetical protein